MRDVTAKTSGGRHDCHSREGHKTTGGLFGSVVPVTPVSSPLESPSSEKVFHPICQSSMVEGGIMLMAAGL